MTGQTIDREASADGVFGLAVSQPTMRWARSAAIVALRVVTLGAGPNNPGGRTVTVRMRSTGEVLLRLAEGFGDQDSDVDAILDDHRWLTARAFALRWLS